MQSCGTKPQTHNTAMMIQAKAASTSIKETLSICPANEQVGEQRLNGLLYAGAHGTPSKSARLSAPMLLRSAKCSALPQRSYTATQGGAPPAQGLMSSSFASFCVHLSLTCLVWDARFTAMAQQPPWHHEFQRQGIQEQVTQRLRCEQPATAQVIPEFTSRRAPDN